MKAQHTPGPWEVSKAAELGFFANDGASAVLQTGEDAKHIAFVSCQTPFKRGSGSSAKCDERDANARLIAAAPELLEALHSLLASYEFYAPDSKVLAGSVYQKARAVIAKAKGE